MLLLDILLYLGGGGRVIVSLAQAKVARASLNPNGEVRLAGTYTSWRPANKTDAPLDTSSIRIEFKQLTLLGHGGLQNRNDSPH
jgi:hypothetical protein